MNRKYHGIVVLDDIYEVCGSVPKVKTNKGFVDAQLLINLRADGSYYGDMESVEALHHDLELEVINGAA